MEEEREDEEYPDWSKGDVSVVSESEGEMASAFHIPCHR